MLKAWGWTILIILLLLLAYSIDLFEFLSSNMFMWLSIVLFVSSILAAFLILGNPFAGDEEDDEKKE